MPYVLSSTLPDHMWCKKSEQFVCVLYVESALTQEQSVVRLKIEPQCLSRQQAS